MRSSEISSSELSEYTPFPPKKYIFIIKNQLLGDNFRFIFLHFFFEILPKFSDLVNSDDCIGKVTSNYVSLQQDFIKKKVLKLIESYFF